MHFMRRLAVLFAAMMICASGHAQVSSTRSSMLTQATGCLVNNATGLISQACVLSLFDNIIASEVTQLDTSNILNGSGIVAANGGSSALTFTAPGSGVLSLLTGTATGTGGPVGCVSPTLTG